MKHIDITEPVIFDKSKILSGVTLRNVHSFPEHGFSISPAMILSDEQAIEHRRRLAEQIQVPFQMMKFQKQVHETEIMEVDSKTGSEELYPHISDGMMTNEIGVVLNVTIADCCAVLLYDPINRAIAALHSGWKGTSLNITQKGIEMIGELYGTEPDRLLVYLSPCAGGDKYEVGYDVARFFPDSVKQISDEKYLFDNKKQIKLQLLEAGVNEKNIEVSDICTISDVKYHSFRRDKDQSGRMACFIGLK
jgi:YfiH family protein